MDPKPDRFSSYWHELKRRKVFNVVATYGATCYIIIEITNNLADSLQLPPWIATLVVLLLIAGLPVAVILSWIFDFTPQGIKKTESAEKEQKEEISPQPLKRKLKRSYILNAVLFTAVIILASRDIFRKDPLERLRSSDKKLSVTVMPFRNLTNDTVLDGWAEWIQTDIISFLSGTKELEVMDQESTNEFIKDRGITNFASVTPDLAGLLSNKQGIDVFVHGIIQRTGSIVKISAQLKDTKTKKVLKPVEVVYDQGKDNLIDITDSLRKKIGDYLLLTKLLKENPGYGSHLTQSPEALQDFIRGNNAASRGEKKSAYEFYSKALKADSNFFWAAFWIERNCPTFEEHLYWLTRNYKIRDRMPDYERLFASWAYAYSFESPEERLKYMLQIREVVGPTLMTLNNLAIAYGQLNQTLKFIPVREEYFKKARRMGSLKKVPPGIYVGLGNAYHNTNQEKKALLTYRKGLKYHPDYSDLMHLQASAFYNMNKQVKGEKFFRKYLDMQKEKYEKQNLKYSEANMTEDKGWLFVNRNMKDSAEFYFWKAIEMQEPDYNYTNLDYMLTIGLMDPKGIKDLDKYLKLMDILVESAKNNKYDRYRYLSRKGRAYLVSGRYQEALEIFQNVYDESPYKLYYMKKDLEDVNKAIGEQTRH
jgi:tetratricopeptide (TPR) repeat protein